MRACEVPELKRDTCLTVISDELGILNKFSSYVKLCRVIAYCRRFRPTNKYRGILCAKEVSESEVQVLRILQATQFRDDIENLKTTRHMNKSKIAGLNPFLDENGLLKGRGSGDRICLSLKNIQSSFRAVIT